MDKVGIRPHVFKSGRFKDMLSGEREPDDDKLSPEERKDRDQEDQMVQALIDETFDKFKDVVKTGRERAAKDNNGKGKTLVDDWRTTPTAAFSPASRPWPWVSWMNWAISTRPSAAPKPSPTSPAPTSSHIACPLIWVGALPHFRQIRGPGDQS